MGRLIQWKVGRLECWNIGILEYWKVIEDSIGYLRAG